MTRRECEVLQLLAEGKSNRKIGEALYISEKTVKNHVSNILQKMNCNDRTQAVVGQLKEVGWKFWINLKGWEWKRPKSRQEEKIICVSPLAVIFSGSIVILGKNLGQVLVYNIGQKL